MVGAGHDDGREGTKHRSREGRDDDVGPGRGGVAVVSVGGRGDRRAVGDALEHVVGPARELGQRQRLDAVAERCATRGRERRVEAERGERLAAGVVVAQLREHAPTLERVVNDIEPRRQRAPRRRRDCVERGRRFRMKTCRTRRERVGRDPIAARDAPAATERFERGERTDLGRRGRRQGLEPVEVGVGACHGASRLQQRHHARAGARGRHLPAGLVGDANAGAFEQRTHAAHEDAVERNQRDRPLAATEMVEHLRGRGPGLVLEAVAERMHRRFGGELARDRRANGWSSGTSVSTTSAGASPSASSAMASGSEPPASIAIHADGRRSNKRSVDDASGAFAAHSRAMRASCFSRPAGPPTATSSESRAACHHAGREHGAIDDAARASSRDVAATRSAACSKPRRSRRIHSAPQRSRASSWVATSVSSAASKLLSPSAAVGGPSEAARVRVVSMRGIQVPRRAKARLAGARSSRNGTRTTASRHDTDSSSRPVGAVGGDRLPKRFDRVIGSRSKGAVRAAGPHAGYRLHRNRWRQAAPARDRYVRMIVPADMLLTSPLQAPPPRHRHEDSPHEQRADHPHVRRIVQADVIEAGTPVLVDYWAEWCGPCKMIAPILDEVSTDYDGKLRSPR